MTFATQLRTDAEPRRRVRAAAPSVAKPPVQPGSDGATVRRMRSRCACGGGCPRCQAPSGLAVGAADDAVEREADSAAERVLRMPAGAGPAPAAAMQPGSGFATPGTFVEAPQVRRRGDGAPASRPAGGAAAPASVASALRSPGRPLDAGSRAFFEPRFGHDFSSVRVHADESAQRSAQDLSARAYTFGDDIVFAAGEFAPATTEGRRLLAHELAHVVQQSAAAPAGIVRRWTIEACEPSQTLYAEEAVQWAIDDLSRVLKMVADPTNDSAWRDALWLAFRDDSDATAELVKTNLAVMRQSLPSATLICMTGCKPDVYAKGDSDARLIYMCMPAFVEKLQTRQQGRTLIHEAAHAFLNLDDTGYFNIASCEETPRMDKAAEPKDSGTAGDNPKDRRNNADSYGCLTYFLLEMKHEKPPEDALVAPGSRNLPNRAAYYRGQKLTIDPSAGTILHAKAQRPGGELFRLFGVPRNSGFRFRWSLAGQGSDGKVHLYSPTSQDGELTGAFDPEHTVVFVPAAVRANLVAYGISRVTLTCEVELYRPLDDEPPITATGIELTVDAGAPSIEKP